MIAKLSLTNQITVPPGKRICLGIVMISSEPEESKLLSADGYQLDTLAFGACTDGDLDAGGGVAIDIGDTETLLERKTLSDYNLGNGTTLQIVFLPAGGYQKLKSE